jgi:1-deoxy-D-xylulose-5-phosphate synthase
LHCITLFNTPDDLLIWDVGHQAYGHKILTGRKEISIPIDNLAVFSQKEARAYDALVRTLLHFNISSLGMAIASNLKGDLDKQHSGDWRCSIAAEWRLKD